jgi:hypothetical protein
MSDTTLITSVVERPIDGSGLISISISGEPYAAAGVGLVVSNYARVTGRNRPAREDLEAMLGEKVTLIIGGENMLGSSLLVAREGRLFQGSGGALAILPKGKRSKGYRVDPERVLDMFPGWVTNVAEANVKAVREQYPELRNLTQERLNELPASSDMCTLALLGRNPVFGGADCLWLIGEYWPEDDICDTNVLLIRPEFGTSEHGSCYGQELLRNRALGEVVGFEPISFSDAIKLCSVDFDEAIATVLGERRPVAA